MQAQFAQDQKGGISDETVGMSLYEALGYDTNGKDYKTFMNITYSTDNNILSNAGQANIQPSTTMTINLQYQNIVYYLKRCAISFLLTTTNGYVENYVSLFESKQVQVGKKSWTTGDARFMQQMMLGFTPRSKLAKYRKGIGMKVSSEYPNTYTAIQAFTALVAIGANEYDTLAHLATAVSTKIQQPLLAQGFVGVIQTALRTDTQADFLADFASSINIPIQAAGVPGLPAVTGVDAPAAGASINTWIGVYNAWVQTQVYLPNQSSRWQAYEYHQLSNQAAQIKGPINQTTTRQCLVPLHYIFREIDQFPCKGGIVLLDGNTCQFQFTLNLPSDCMIATGASPNYSCSNFQLVQCMSPELTSQQISNIRGSQFLYRPIRGYPCQTQAVTQTINLTAAIPLGCRARAFYFAFFANGPSTNTPTALCDGVTENLVTMRNGAYSRLNYILGFSPVAPVRECVLQVNGQSRIVNAYLVQNFDELSFVEGETSCYENALQQQIKCYYKIDMDRFSEDMFGSSLEPSPFNIIIQLEAASYGISGQSEPFTFDVQGNGMASTQRYQCRGYLILQEHLELDKGVWKY